MFGFPEPILGVIARAFEKKCLDVLDFARVREPSRRRVGERVLDEGSEQFSLDPRDVLERFDRILVLEGEARRRCAQVCHGGAHCRTAASSAPSSRAMAPISSWMQ
jgi:hypothetical protein